MATRRNSEWRTFGAPLLAFLRRRASVVLAVLLTAALILQLRAAREFTHVTPPPPFRHGVVVASRDTKAVAMDAKPVEPLSAEEVLDLAIWDRKRRRKAVRAYLGVDCSLMHELLTAGLLMKRTGRMLRQLSSAVSDGLGSERDTDVLDEFRRTRHPRLRACMSPTPLPTRMLLIQPDPFVASLISSLGVDQIVAVGPMSRTTAALLETERRCVGTGDVEFRLDSFYTSAVEAPDEHPSKLRWDRHRVEASKEQTAYSAPGAAVVGAMPRSIVATSDGVVKKLIDPMRRTLFSMVHGSNIRAESIEQRLYRKIVAAGITVNFEAELRGRSKMAVSSSTDVRASYDVVTLCPLPTRRTVTSEHATLLHDDATSSYADFLLRRMVYAGDRAVRRVVLCYDTRDEAVFFTAEATPADKQQRDREQQAAAASHARTNAGVRDVAAALRLAIGRLINLEFAAGESNNELSLRRFVVSNFECDGQADCETLQYAFSGLDPASPAAKATNLDVVLRGRLDRYPGMVVLDSVIVAIPAMTLYEIKTFNEERSLHEPNVRRFELIQSATLFPNAVQHIRDEMSMDDVRDPVCVPFIERVRTRARVVRDDFAALQKAHMASPGDMMKHAGSISYHVARGRAVKPTDSRVLQYVPTVMYRFLGLADHIASWRLRLNAPTFGKIGEEFTDALLDDLSDPVVVQSAANAMMDAVMLGQVSLGYPASATSTSAVYAKSLAAKFDLKDRNLVSAFAPGFAVGVSPDDDDADGRRGKAKGDKLPFARQAPFDLVGPGVADRFAYSKDLHRHRVHLRAQPGTKEEDEERAFDPMIFNEGLRDDFFLTASGDLHYQQPPPDKVPDSRVDTVTANRNYQRLAKSMCNAALFSLLRRCTGCRNMTRDTMNRLLPLHHLFDEAPFAFGTARLEAHQRFEQRAMDADAEAGDAGHRGEDKALGATSPYCDDFDEPMRDGDRSVTNGAMAAVATADDESVILFRFLAATAWVPLVFTGGELKRNAWAEPQTQTTFLRQRLSDVVTFSREDSPNPFAISLGVAPPGGDTKAVASAADSAEVETVLGGKPDLVRSAVTTPDIEILTRHGPVQHLRLSLAPHPTLTTASTLEKVLSLIRQITDATAMGEKRSRVAEDPLSKPWIMLASCIPSMIPVMLQALTPKQPLTHIFTFGVGQSSLSAASLRMQLVNDADCAEVDDVVTRFTTAPSLLPKLRRPTLLQGVFAFPDVPTSSIEAPFAQFRFKSSAAVANYDPMNAGHAGVTADGIHWQNGSVLLIDPYFFLRLEDEEAAAANDQRFPRVGPSAWILAMFQHVLVLNTDVPPSTLAAPSGALDAWLADGNERLRSWTAKRKSANQREWQTFLLANRTAAADGRTLPQPPAAVEPQSGLNDHEMAVREAFRRHIQRGTERRDRFDRKYRSAVIEPDVLFAALSEGLRRLSDAGFVEHPGIGEGTRLFFRTR